MRSAVESNEHLVRCDAYVGRRVNEISEDLALSLTGANLLAEEYFNSADRKNTWAPGRTIGLALRWRPEGR